MSGHAIQQATIQELKKRASELARLPRNRGWFELSQVLELLNGHRGEKGRDQFQNLILDGTLSHRTAYYLRDVGQLIRTAKLSTNQVERIGWTKLQIISHKMDGKNAALLLKLVRENNTQELKRKIRDDSAKSRPHCVLLYFNTGQYRRFRKAILRHGGSRAGRGIVGKEEAIMDIIRRAEA